MVSAGFVILSSVILGIVTAADEYLPFDRTKLGPNSVFEQFDYEDLDHSPWKPSVASKYDEATKETVQYVGKWAIEPVSVYPGYKNDKGLVLKTKAAHHAIAYKLDQPLDNTDKDLVLQYEIKLQNGLECGGTYIKLLNAAEDYSLFNVDTPFQIMFGPDKCGANDKIHFIINRKNPKTGLMEEKSLATPPPSRGGELTTLYTLIMRRSQDIEIRINGNVVYAGNLLDEGTLTPPLNPPKQVTDVLDTKPLDWDDREYIPDPKHIAKPDDYELKHKWMTIPDVNAIKPEGWGDELEPFIEDPLASKPVYWDDEEDGEWIAPDIPNPECVGLPGCGKWSPPTVPNPHYIGPWLHPKIPNPSYQGEWEPRTIDNPDYYEDSTPSNLDSPIGGIAFELWSMDTQILFDNIYLGHSIEEAELVGNQTFKPKFELEATNRRCNRPKSKYEPSPPPPSFDDLVLQADSSSTVWQFFKFLRLLVKKQTLEAKDFYYQFFLNPIDLIITHPVKFVIYCIAFTTLLTFMFGFGAVVIFVASNWRNPPPPVKIYQDGETRMMKNTQIEELSDVEVEEIQEVKSSIKKRK